MSTEPDNDWESNRKRVTYREGVRVLEAQKADIDDIDDKALRTVRVTALLLGVGATGIRVIGTENINRVAVGLSLGSFLLSLFFGVVVYDESNEVIGPKGSYIKQLKDYSMAEPWEDDFFHQLHGWIDDNQAIVESNAYLLRACEAFFVLGIGFGTVALLDLGLGAVLLLVLVLVLVISLVGFYIGSRVDRS